MPNPNDTGNMMQDMMSQSVPVEELQAKQSQRIAIVGAGEHHATMTARVRNLIESLSDESGEVVVIDSLSQLPKDTRLLDLDAHIGALDGFRILPARPEIKAKPAPKPKEKTREDFLALVKAQAKRERKAAKLRGRK